MGNTTIPAELVAINAIQGTLIADNAITSVHIAQNNVTAVQIAINAVTATQIADGTITSAKIADGTIVTADIADGQITTAKLVDSSVTSAKIAAGTIVGGDIANNAILTQHIDDNQITADQIADNAVGLGQMAGLTRGSIIYGDSAGDPAYLAAGTSGHVLTSDGTDISWTADTDLFLATTGGTITGDLTISEATPTLKFTDTDNNYDATIAGLSGSLVLKADSGTEIGTETIQFWRGDSEVMHIDNTGVGIGTDNPGFDLDVSGLLRVTSDVYLQGDVYVDSKIRHNGDVDNYISFSAADTQSFVTGNSTRLQITSSLVRLNQEGLNQDFQIFGENDDNLFYVDASADKVGIGTTSPHKKLEVAGDIQLDATDANIWLKSGATGTNGFINWTFNSDSTVYNKIGMDYDTRATTGFHIDAGYPITIDATASSGNGINFAISGSNKVQIDGSGKLTVTNAINASLGNLTVQGTTGHTYIGVNRPAASTGEVGYSYNTNNGTVWWNYLPANDSTLKWYSSGGNKMTLSQSGLLTVAGGITSSSGTVQFTDGSALFDSSDSNGYPRFTHVNGSAQLALFRSGSSAGGAYIGGDSDGFHIRNGSVSLKASILQGGTAKINLNGTSDTALQIGDTTRDQAVEMSKASGGAVTREIIRFNGPLRLGTTTGSHETYITGGGASYVKVDTSGNLVPGANNGQDLGTSSYVWRDLYIGDLVLSNEDRVNDDGTKGNSFDGTTGNWRIQEGEEHLYIINNKNGKKYKFSLEEIE